MDQLPLTVNPAMQWRKGTPHPAMQRRKGLIPSGASLAGCAPVPLPLLRHNTSQQSRDVCETAGPPKKRAPRDSDYMSDDDCFDGWLGMMTPTLRASNPVQRQEQGTDHPSQHLHSSPNNPDHKQPLRILKMSSSTSEQLSACRQS